MIGCVNTHPILESLQLEGSYMGDLLYIILVSFYGIS